MALKLLTDKKAVLDALRASLPLCFFPHLLGGFTDQLWFRIVAKRDALKKIIHSEELHDPLRMGDISVGEQPGLDFGSVEIGEQFPQFGVRL